MSYGTAVKFPFEVTQSGGLENAVEVEAVIQSCYELLDTPYGSIWFNEHYGSRLHELRWEWNESIFRYLAKLFIREALEKYEPRVKYQGALISFSDDGLASILISGLLRDIDEEISFEYKYKRLQA